ncbi:hypothetical protein [Streptomyces sp. NPDC088762]|uniref:hypothetical protein n=1 Tax=Streptomyces sp. NPDC088762 TaxID=3365891 RepID=UPI003829CBA8
MNATVPTPDHAAPQIQDREPDRRDRRLRVAAGIALGLLVPSLIAAYIALLASPRAGRCIAYAEDCAPGAPVTWVLWAVAVTTVAGLLAVCWPARRLPSPGARAWMTGLQVASHVAALLFILSHYA